MSPLMYSLSSIFLFTVVKFTWNKPTILTIFNALLRGGKHVLNAIQWSLPSSSSFFFETCRAGWPWTPYELKLLILLPLPPQHWDHGCACLCLVHGVLDFRRSRTFAFPQTNLSPSTLMYYPSSRHWRCSPSHCYELDHPRNLIWVKFYGPFPFMADLF